MKKKILLVLAFILLMPIMSVKAASITRLDVSGASNATVGSYINVSFYVDYSGVQKNTTNSMGVGAVVYELTFDDSVFSVTKTSSNGFDTGIVKENGRYYVTSIINDSDASNKCADGVLYCNNYVATITFYVKDTDKQSSNISISNGNVILYEVGLENEKETIINSYSESTHVVNITKTDSQTVEEPKSIVSSGSKQSAINQAEKKISKVQEKTVTTTKATTTVIDKSNNYLSSLRVKNHRINFNKDTLEYKIYVKDDEKKLDIEAKAESDKATVKITGADDLKKNNDVVLIEVTSQDGKVRTYKVNVGHYGKAKKDEEDDNKKKISLSKNQIKIIIISASAVVVLAGIVLIIKVRNNKKLDKMFDNFDKF